MAKTLLGGLWERQEVLPVSALDLDTFVRGESPDTPQGPPQPTETKVRGESSIPSALWHGSGDPDYPPDEDGPLTRTRGEGVD